MILDVESIYNLMGKCQATSHCMAKTKPLTILFNKIRAVKHVSYHISLNMKPTMIDEVRTSIYCQFVHLEQVISGYKYIANNFAHGHLTNKAFFEFVKLNIIGFAFVVSINKVANH